MLKFGISPNNVSDFMTLLGNLQNKLPNIIHIAGTNGKGSTTTFLRFILETHGYTVNTFTSPHLIKYNERFRILGKVISDDTLNDIRTYLSKISGFDNLSMFEMATVIFFLASYQFKSDFTIVETGLGGRLDATNVISKDKLVVLTSIGLDHQKFLGDDLETIASEKAGIITKNSLVISGYQTENVIKVFANISKQKKVSFFYGGLDYLVHVDGLKQQHKCSFSQKDYSLKTISLPGKHQLYNASLAIYSASKLIQLKENRINQALYNSKWPGRLEKVKKLYGRNINFPFYLDGAHNDIGFLALKNFILQYRSADSKIYLILGILKNKDLLQFFNIFDDLKAKIIIYSCDIPDHFSFSKEEIYNLAQEYKFTALLFHDIKQIISDVAQKAKIHDLGILTGSLYLVGKVLKENNIQID